MPWVSRSRRAGAGTGPDNAGLHERGETSALGGQQTDASFTTGSVVVGEPQLVTGVGSRVSWAYSLYGGTPGGDCVRPQMGPPQYLPGASFLGTEGPSPAGPRQAIRPLYMQPLGERLASPPAEAGRKATIWPPEQKQ